MTRSSTKKAAKYCECCNDRFIPGGIANHGICIACTRIAQDIIRVCGFEYVSSKSVLFARNRQRLAPLIAAAPQPLFSTSAKSAQPQPGLSGSNKEAK